MELKINSQQLRIPDKANESLLQQSQQLLRNDGKLDENELMTLISEAEKGGMNLDEQNFLAALMDKGVASTIEKTEFNPSQLSFQVDEGQHAANLARLNALRAKLGPAVPNPAAAEQRLNQKLDAAAGWVDQQVQAHGSINGDSSHYHPDAEKALKAKVNATADLKAGDEHCAATVGQSYTDQGFRYPGSMGSTDKAVGFFLYHDILSEKGQGRNKDFEKDKQADAAAGTGRKLFLLKGANDKDMKTYIDKYHQFDAAKNTFEWQNLPIRKGDTILMKPKEPASEGPAHAAMVKDYNPKNGSLILIQGNPLQEQSFDLTKASDRAKFMAFGRPSPNDFQ